MFIVSVFRVLAIILIVYLLSNNSKSSTEDHENNLNNHIKERFNITYRFRDSLKSNFSFIKKISSDRYKKLTLRYNNKEKNLRKILEGRKVASFFRSSPLLQNEINIFLNNKINENWNRNSFAN